MGQMSSLALRVIERLNAELGQADDMGRPLTFGKVAAAVVVGNEDGAHKISADLFQSLNDLGFSLPAQAATYWNGEAMQMVDYVDLDDIPELVEQNNRVLARNLGHLAKLLRTNQYPGNK